MKRDVKIERYKAADGFTLMELLVVMALVSVLLVLTTTFGNRALGLIGQVGSRSASDRIAELVFEQFSRDLGQRVVRRETTIRIHKEADGGDDELVLVTRRFGLSERAAVADRRVSTVHYRVAEHVLFQGAEGFGFGSTSAPPLPADGMLDLHGLPEEGPEGLAERSMYPLADGVIRMEFSFITLGADGTPEIKAAPPQAPELPSAMVVTLAVLDPERTRMIGREERERIAAEFPDAGDGVLPGGRWLEVARGLAGRAGDLRVPAVALGQVRVYQRRFPVSSGGNLNP